MDLERRVPMHSGVIGMQHINIKEQVNSWRDYVNNIRTKGVPLLEKLDEFPGAILVSGCQRSGTTMMTRVINQSDDIADIKYGYDDELDVALILSGWRPLHINKEKKYCFQTTYLNNSYREYFEHDNYKLIWVVRNPYSVVRSLLYNWTRYALNDLYLTCGKCYMEKIAETEKPPVNYWAPWRKNIYKACYSYNGKISQIIEIKKTIRDEQLLVVGYEDIISNSSLILPKVFDFIGIEYKDEFTDIVNRKNKNKKRILSLEEENIINHMCVPVYQEVKELCYL